jgi:acyl dehydratase
MNDAREPLTSFRVAAVNAERMKALALLVEDPNPIHIFPEDAAAAGLGDRVINPGSANLGYVLNALLAIDPNVEIENVRIALRGNVAAGDEVVAAALWSGDEIDDGRLRLRCEVGRRHGRVTGDGGNRRCDDPQSSNRSAKSLDREASTGAARSHRRVRGMWATELACEAGGATVRARSRRALGDLSVHPVGYLV